MSAVLDIHSTVQYFHPSDRIVYSVSDSDQVREVKNSGQTNERLLPAGRDSGYLWRASTFTVLIEQQADVNVVVNARAERTLSRGPWLVRTHIGVSWEESRPGRCSGGFRGQTLGIGRHYYAVHGN